MDPSVPNEILLNTFFAFCTARDMSALRTTSREWNATIPAYWIVDNLYVTDRLDFNSRNFFIAREIPVRHPRENVPLLHCDYPFMQQLTLLNTFKVEQLTLGPSFRHLQIFNGISLDRLERFQIDPTLTRLRDLFLSNAPRLRLLSIPPACTALRTVMISHTPLKGTFVIPETWTQLHHLALINVGELTGVFIPSTCTQMESLNISSSAINTIEYRAVIPAQIPMVGIYQHNAPASHLELRTPAHNRDRFYVATMVGYTVTYT